MPTGELEIAAIYRRHIVMVRRRAGRLLSPAAAEDVAQEAFIRYIKSRRRGTVEDNTAALLYRIVTNLALNRLRTERSRRDALAREAPRDAEAESGVDARLDVRRVLGQVDLEEARIATYYYVDGMEQEEIATLLGIQRRTVGRRLERFRKQARRILERSSSPPLEGARHAVG